MASKYLKNIKIYKWFNTYIVNNIVFSTTITHILYSISKDLHFGTILKCQNNYCCAKKQPTGSQSSSMAE